MASAWRVVAGGYTEYLDIFTYKQPPTNAPGMNIVDVQGDHAAFHGWFPNLYGRTFCLT